MGIEVLTFVFDSLENQLVLTNLKRRKHAWTIFRNLAAIPYHFNNSTSDSVLI